MRGVRSIGASGRVPPGRSASWRRMVFAAAGFAVLAAGPAVMTARAERTAPHYHLAKSLPIPGDGGWDYLTVDAGARRLYVSHNTRVHVVDIDHDSIVGEIGGLNGVHGIALAPALGRGFITSGRDSMLIAFDLKTYATLDRIHVPARFPDAVCAEPVSKRVFTFNGGSANTTAFDAATGKSAGEIALHGKPEFAVADGTGLIFVNNEDSSRVVAFDATRLAVKAEWPLAPGETPTGLAFDAAGHRLFSACEESQSVVVLDSKSGRVLQSLPIGQGCDGVAYDPDAHRVFATNGEGTLTVIGEDEAGHLAVLETVATRTGARTVAVDPRTHRVFTTTADFGPRPAPDAEHPRPRAPILPGTFALLILAP